MKLFHFEVRYIRTGLESVLMLSTLLKYHQTKFWKRGETSIRPVLGCPQDSLALKVRNMHPDKSLFTKHSVEFINILHMF